MSNTVMDRLYRLITESKAIIQDIVSHYKKKDDGTCVIDLSKIDIDDRECIYTDEQGDAEYAFIDSIELKEGHIYLNIITDSDMSERENINIKGELTQTTTDNIDAHSIINLADQLSRAYPINAIFSGNKNESI